MAQDPTIPTIVPDIGRSARVQAFAPAIDISPANCYYERMQGYGRQALELAQALSLQQSAAESKEAFNRFDAELKEFTNSNFYSKQNKDLVQSYQPTLNGLYDIAKRYADGLSGGAREMFIQSANERMRMAANQMNTRYMKGVIDWNNTESQARIQNLINDAIADIDDWQNPESAFQISLTATRNELSENLQYNGVQRGTEAYKQAMLGTLSSFHGGSLDTFINNDDVRQGRAYLTKYRDEMTAEDVLKYEGRLKRLQDAINARYAAQMAAKQAEANRLKGLSYEQQWQMAYAKYEQDVAAVRSDSKLTDKQKIDKLQELATDISVVNASLLKASQIFRLNEKSSKLVQHDLALQKAQLAFAENRADNGKNETVLTPEDIYSASEIQRFQEAGIYEEVMDFVKNRGVIVPHSSDYEAYDAILANPNQYVNMSDTDLSYLIRNFDDNMKTEARKAIQGAVTGILDPTNTQVNQALTSMGIADKATQGKARLFIQNRRNEILRSSGKTPTAKEIEAANAQAILELSRIDKEGSFWGTVNASADFLNATPASRSSMFIHRTYETTYGQDIDIRIPTEWYYSEEGQQVARAVLAQVKQTYGVGVSSDLYWDALRRAYEGTTAGGLDLIKRLGLEQKMGLR